MRHEAKHKIALDWRNGRFLNIEEGRGYTLTPLAGQKGWFIFQLNPDTPLCFVFPDGGCAQPNMYLRTDLGSVPYILQWIVGPGEWKIQFIYHDNVCSKGGLWYRPPGMKEFHFLPMGRRAGDRMLADTIHAGGGSFLHENEVYTMIRLWAMIIRFNWT